MAVYSCPQITVSIPTGKEKDVLSRIQQIGSIELLSPEESVQLPEELLTEETRIMTELETANKALDALTTYQQKKGALDALKDSRVPLSREEYAELEAKKEKLQTLADAIQIAHNEELKLAEEIKSLENTLHTVTPLQEVDVKIFGTFEFVAMVPFFVHESRMDAVLGEISRRFPDAVVESIDKLGEEYVYVAAVEKEKKEAVVGYLMDNATIINVDSEMTGSFRDIFEGSSKRMAEAKSRIEEIHVFMKEHADNAKQIMTLKDILHSELQQIFAYHNLIPAGEGMMATRGYIDPARIDETVASLEEVPGVSVSIADAAEYKKVVMKNNWFVRPFEAVTKLMGVPMGNAIDPTPALAGFFVLMYGLALSEAGYALVCLILIGSLLLAVKRIKPSIKSIMLIIFYASISTLIVGAIFGSWFGVTPWDIDTSNPDKYLPHTQFLINIGWWPLAQELQQFNPVQKILALMIAMSILGFFHLLFALMLGLRQSQRRGEFSQGVMVYGTWIGFLVLIAVNILNMQGYFGAAAQGSSVFTYAMLVYMVIMVPAVGREANGIGGKIGKGAFDLFFGAVGYISDVLSYTRLVALGLATGIIAAVVNTLAGIAGGGLAAQGGGKMIIGYLIMIIIFVGGHVFNIGLNVLGSYITVGRLHFVEFFSKFFESGGEELKPFAVSEEYIQLTNK